MRSIAILAGGRATRFDGCDKSALVVDGHTILDRQLDELSSLTDDIMLVGEVPGGARSLAEARQARRREPSVEVRLVRDIVPGCGPLGGLHAALTAARGDFVFVVACDMPYVTAAFADHL